MRHGPGCYVVRTRKPSAIIGLPIIGRHFGYVGEGFSTALREREHLNGSSRYGAPPKPWSDLDPKFYHIPLPFAWKWLLRSVETVLMLLTWPVYNHQKNLWNPRRIPLHAQKAQRRIRDSSPRILAAVMSFGIRHAVLLAMMVGLWFWVTR